MKDDPATKPHPPDPVRPCPAPNLRHLTTGELRNPGNTRLSESIVAKLHTLDPNGFVEGQLTLKVRVLLELLRDVLRGRYPHLSVVAFADILLAMNHFLEVRDTIPDTLERGYEDDHRHVARICELHAREIAGYQGWKILRAAREG